MAAGRRGSREIIGRLILTIVYNSMQHYSNSAQMFHQKSIYTSLFKYKAPKLLQDAQKKLSSDRDVYCMSEDESQRGDRKGRIQQRKHELVLTSGSLHAAIKVELRLVSVASTQVVNTFDLSGVTMILIWLSLCCKSSSNPCFAISSRCIRLVIMVSTPLNLPVPVISSSQAFTVLLTCYKGIDCLPEVFIIVCQHALCCDFLQDVVHKGYDHL